MPRNQLRQALAVLLVLVGVVTFVILRARRSTAAPPPLVPSRATTYLTEPARADGTIDYARYFREKVGQGVTPENNAAPLLARCLGEEVPGLEMPEGIPPLEQAFEELATWCVSEDRSRDRHDDGLMDELAAELERARTGDVDTPHAELMHEWLSAMEPALDLAALAARRERCFVPPTPTLSETPLLMVAFLGEGLSYRAAMRSSSGDWAGALDDLETELRLSRPFGDVPGLLSLLDPMRREQLARRDALGIARAHGGLTTAEFRRLDAALPTEPCVEIVRTALHWERLSQLESLNPELDPRTSSRVAGDDPVAVQKLRDAARGETRPVEEPQRIDPRTVPGYDPNVMYSAANALLDEIEAIALGPKDWESKVRALRERSDRWKRRFEEERSPFRHLLRRWLAGPRLSSETLQFFGEFLMGAELPYAIQSIGDCLDESLCADLDRVGLAALAFKTATGRDPASIADLVPVCFDAPPRDRVTGEPITLRLDESGRLLVESSASTPVARIKQLLADAR